MTELSRRSTTRNDVRQSHFPLQLLSKNYSKKKVKDSNIAHVTKSWSYQSVAHKMSISGAGRGKKKRSVLIYKHTRSRGKCYGSMEMFILLPRSHTGKSLFLCRRITFAFQALRVKPHCLETREISLVLCMSCINVNKFWSETGLGCDIEFVTKADYTIVIGMVWLEL